MRLVTDGKKFAVVRRRWIFTQFLDLNDGSWTPIWWKFHVIFYSIFWSTKEYAQERMEMIKRFKDYHDYKEE